MLPFEIFLTHLIHSALDLFPIEGRVANIGDINILVGIYFGCFFISLESTLRGALQYQ